MRCKHVPYLLIVSQDPNRNALPQGKWVIINGVLPAASGVAVGSLYMRGMRHVYTCHVLLTQGPGDSNSKKNHLTMLSFDKVTDTRCE